MAFGLPQHELALFYSCAAIEITLPRRKVAEHIWQFGLQARSNFFDPPRSALTNILRGSVLILSIGSLLKRDFGAPPATRAAVG